MSDHNPLLVATWPYERALAQALDPTTPGRRLLELLGVEKLRPLIHRNPNLPDVWILQLMIEGDVDAWQNPSAELLALNRPGPELRRGAAHAVGRLASRLGWPPSMPLTSWRPDRLAARLRQRLELEARRAEGGVPTEEPPYGRRTARHRIGRGQQRLVVEEPLTPAECALLDRLARVLGG